MKKITTFLLLVLTFSFLGVNQAYADLNYVEGYTRSDGTYVEGHLRSDPDGYEYNNLGSDGIDMDGDGYGAEETNDYYSDYNFENTDSSYSNDIEIDYSSDNSSYNNTSNYSSDYDYKDTYSYSTTSDCPTNSYYDSLSESCKCNSGYMAQDGECIDKDNYCENKFGYGASYNSLEGSCECGSGDVLNENQTSCIDGEDYCEEKYGDNAEYDSLSSRCGCEYGYEIKNGECVDEDKNNNYDSLNNYSSSDISSLFNSLCSENSSYNTSDNTCYCNSGYKANPEGDKCVKEKEENKKCPDMTNGYYSETNDKCYCNRGYKWSNKEQECTKRTDNKTSTNKSSNDYVKAKYSNKVYEGIGDDSIPGVTMDSGRKYKKINEKREWYQIKIDSRKGWVPEHWVE